MVRWETILIHRIIPWGNIITTEHNKCRSQDGSGPSWSTAGPATRGLRECCGVVTTPLQTLERRSCTSNNNTTATTIMTLLLLFYMVPYRLTPPSMKGLLFDAIPPVVLRPPVCPRSGFRQLLVLLPCEPGPLDGDSTTAPGAPPETAKHALRIGRAQVDTLAHPRQSYAGARAHQPRFQRHLDSRFRWYPHYHSWD